jgi:acetate kinase
VKTLVINVGSTSLKFKLYLMPEERILASGRLEGIGQNQSDYQLATPGRETLKGQAKFDGYGDGIERILAYLLSPDSGAITSLGEVAAVGFKTVLAKNIVDAVLLDEGALGAMEEMTRLAPSHNPPYIAAIRDIGERLPDTPLVGLFEPAFHKSIPEHAWRYAVPYEWAEKYGIRRYGFHGASHRYAAERAAQMIGNRDLRLISCHLGGSSSLNATRGTRSLDNSFGLSPQSGMIQSNRPGDVDIFIAFFLMEQYGLTAEQIRKDLSSNSGLKGMSGVSAEMRDVLEAAETGNARAKLTVDAYVYRVRKEIGAYAVVLGGVDAVVFTGGIGERSAMLRERVCDGLGFLGVELDPDQNASCKPDADVAAAGSKARVLIVEANEELIVARACAEKLAGNG